MTDTALDGLSKSVNKDIDGLKADVSDVVNHAVKTSEQLISDKRTTDKVPYKYRASASGKSDRAYDMIVGGTVCFNQLVPTASKDFTSTVTDTKSFIDLIFRLDTSPYTIFMTKRLTTAGIVEHICKSTATGTAQLLHSGTQKNLKFWEGVNVVSEHVYFVYVNFTGVDLATVGGVIAKNMMLIDLTQMFGTAIADHIYSLEQATAGAGVALITPMHSDGSVNYEELALWDEEWEAGTYNNNTGEKMNNTNYWRSKNMIPIFPSTPYYFNTSSHKLFRYIYDAEGTYIGYLNSINNGLWVTPSNAHYLNIVDIDSKSYNPNDKPVCISLSSDKNGQYEPHRKTVYPLDSSLTLRGVPVLKDGKIEFDGDTYEADGTVTRRYGVVDLGTLDWLYRDSGSYNVKPFLANLSGMALPSTSSIIILALCSKYTQVAPNKLNVSGADKIFGIAKYFSATHSINIVDTDYTDATAFKSAMSGVYLIYQLETPTTEEALPYTNPQVVSPYGTEEYISESVCPVGHVTEYPDNLRAKIDGLPWDLSMIAPVEVTYMATRNYTVGQLLIVDNTLYKVTANIANGGTITPNTNVTATTLSEVIASLS